MGGTATVILCFAPAFPFVIKKFVRRLLRQRIGIGRHTAVNLYLHAERLRRIFLLWQSNHDIADRFSRDRIFIEVPQRNGSEDKRRSLWDNLQGFQRLRRVRIFPDPQIVVRRSRLRGFGLPVARSAPISFVAWVKSILLIWPCEKRQLPPTRRDDSDLEPFSYRRRDRFTVCIVENVVRNQTPDGITFKDFRFE